VSWSISAGPAAKEAISYTEPAYAAEVETEQRDQLEAAKVAAGVLAQAVGRPDDDIRVTVSGHANPEHGPRDGWASEMITVSVSARPKQD
jgi:hypothetical protein